MLSKIKVVFFFNNERGLKVLSCLKKIKIKIQKIFVSKKNLRKDFLKKLQKKKIKFQIIDNLEKKIVNKMLRLSDVGIVCGFPYIFKKDLLNLSKYGIINCHAGKLPKYRGGSPLNWQIINNEKFFGLSIIKIDENIDTGKIIEEKKFKLLKKYNINHLHKIANNQFPIMVIKSLSKLKRNIKFKNQSIKNVNYFRQRNQKDSEIIFNKVTFKKIQLYIRALQPPYPEPYFFYNKKKMIIKKVSITHTKIIPNKILKIKDHFYVKCKNAKLKIDCNFK